MYWNNLVENWYRPVFGFACHFLGDRQAAEDVTQETFLAAFRKLEQFRSQGSIKSWLFTICHNRCIDRRRWWKRWRERLHVHHADKSETQDGALPQDLKEALLNLPPRQREVLLLRHFYGFSTDETAGVLGISAGAVKSHLSRAVFSMKKSLLEDSAGNQTGD